MAAAYVAERGTLSINNGSGTTQAVTLSANCTAANTVLLLWGSRDTSATGISIADSRSNTWTIDVGPLNGSNNLVFVASTQQDGGTLQNADTVTVTFGTAPGNARLARLEEFSGLASASYVDQTASATSAAATSLPTGTTGTTTQADELAIAAWCGSSEASFAGDAAYTNLGTLVQVQTGTPDGLKKYLAGQYKILSATGTQQATATSTSGSYQGVIVTYKAAVAAAATPTLMLLGVGT